MKRTSSTSITNGADTTVGFSNTVLDADSAYSSGTGLFTVPTNKGGPYMVTAFCEFSAFSLGTGGTIRTGVIVNGSVTRYVDDYQPNATATIAWSAGGSTLLNLSAGDTVGITMFQNSGSNRGLAGSDAQRQHFTISQIR